MRSILRRALRFASRAKRRVKESLTAFSEGVGGRSEATVPLARADFLALFEISAVAVALAEGDEDRAEWELLAHYAKRVQERWLPAPPELTDLRIRLDDLSREELLQAAERVLDHHVTPAQQQPGLTDRGVIDWTHNPTSDREWLLKINRHAWWVVLGVAYRETADERYAARFVEQLIDWIDHNPPCPRKDEKSPTWRLMEVGLRLRVSWIPSFGLFFDSPTFTDAAKLKMLRSFCDHGRFLGRFKTDRNHLLRESNGLAYLAANLPEFREAREWLRCALERIEGEVREQVNEDGTHIEMSTGYQWLVIDEFEKTANLLREHDLRMPHEDLHQWLERMYDVLARVLLPDGTVPQINDGFLLWSHTRIATAGRGFARPDFVFVGTDGSEGECPTETSCLIRDAGLHVMRSDWTREARYLLFDAGPHGGHHGHEDKLSVTELCAYGERFLADPGSFTYDKRNPFRSYFASSAGHNTVTVDGKSQVRIWNRAYLAPSVARGDCSSWICREVFDYARGRYDEGYGEYAHPQPPDAVRLDDVVHERRVLFVKPDYWIVLDDLQTNQAHRYDWSFHAPKVFDTDEGEGGRITLGANEAPRLLIQPVATEGLTAQIYCGSEDPIQGWYSSDHRVKEPATAVIYTRSVSGPCEAAFLLYPSRAGTSLAGARLEELETSGRASAFVVTHDGGERDYVLVADTAEERSLGPHQVTGAVAVVRTDVDGGVVARDDWVPDDRESEV